MKLMVPVAGMVFAAGTCCCGDFTEEFQKGFDEEFGKAMEQAAEEAAKQATPEGGVTVTTGDGTTVTVGATATAGGGGLETVGGACGRFKDMGVVGPSGFSVLMCSDTGGSAALTIQGDGDNVAHCKSLKGWVSDKGYSLVVENDSGDTYSLVTKKGSESFVVNCMKQAGGVWISYSVTPGM
jgi:hypothetical protein